MLDNFVGLGYGLGLGEGTTDTDADALIAQGKAFLAQTTVSYKRWAATAYPDVKVTNWWRGLDALAQAQALLGSTPPPPPPPPPGGGVLWSDPDAVLDQGNFGTCVGNGAAQFLNTLPISDGYTEGVGQSARAGGPYARALYYEATVLDGSPDDPNSAGGGQQGATVKSGVVALYNRARIASYAQSSSFSVLETWLKTKGAIVIGSDWTNDMFSPDGSGYVVPSGGVAGGHCYLWDEITAGGDYGFLNSWGSAWGVGGRFYMKKTDFVSLFASQGEAWTAVELPL